MRRAATPSELVLKSLGERAKARSILARAPNQVPCWRYRIVYDTLCEKAGASTSVDAMSLIRKVSQQNTVWSAVYDPEDLEMSLAAGGNYGNVSFKLKK